MRNLISKVLKALRRTLRAMTGVVVYSLSLATGLITAAFRRAEYDEQPEEIASEAIDAKVEEAVAPPSARPMQDGTLAQRVKNALLALDANRPIDAEFDLARPDHVMALAWFETLDEGHLRALRHMPMPALGAHLNTKYSVRAAGLPRFPVVANENAPSVDEAFDVDFGMVELQARP